LNKNQHTIVATEDIPVHGVKKGDIGGQVVVSNRLYSDPNTALSREYKDNAWVTQGALSQSSFMSGNALISGNAKVFNSKLHDDSIVTSESFIQGIPQNAAVRATDVEMYGSSMISTASVVAGTTLNHTDHAKLMHFSDVSIRTIEDLGYRIVGLLSANVFNLNWANKRQYLIQATRDIPYQGVKKGDLGGYIDSMTAKHDGRYILTLSNDAWVFPNVLLCNSSLRERASASGELVITDSLIRDTSVAHGFGEISKIMMSGSSELYLPFIASENNNPHSVFSNYKLNNQTYTVKNLQSDKTLIT